MLLLLPAVSLNAPAARSTFRVPLLLAVGVTTSVADLLSLAIAKAPLVPPVTATAAALKLLPTDSLNVKVNVTGPSVLAAATLSVMTTVGAWVSGGAVASPPPQAVSRTVVASAQADRANCLEIVFMWAS